MLENIFAVNGNITGVIIRLTIAVILFPHGAQKLLGWFGGFGYNGTMSFFVENVHLPYFVGLSVILLEFSGPVLLAAGFATRIVALGIIGLMIGIILTSHLQNGFFMNWLGNQRGEGFEFHLLVIGLSIALLLEGAGKFSLDGYLFN